MVCLSTLQNYFVRRLFSMFDRDGNGRITELEFIDGMKHYNNRDPTVKLMFLYQIFDCDGQCTVCRYF